MANMTLDQDKQRFAAWRSQRNGRQPIPEDLWRLACKHIPFLGISRVAREFRLNDSKLREKALREGITLSRLGKQNGLQPEKVAFQEISLNRSMFLPSLPSPSLVLERPDGTRVRIEGQLPDPEYVGKLAACLWR
jgi:hypothetical protein